MSPRLDLSASASGGTPYLRRPSHLRPAATSLMGINPQQQRKLWVRSHVSVLTLTAVNCPLGSVQAATNMMRIGCFKCCLRADSTCSDVPQWPSNEAPRFGYDCSAWAI